MGLNLKYAGVCFKNKKWPVSQSGNKLAQVLARSLKKEVRAYEFWNSQLGAGDIPKGAFAEAVERWAFLPHVISQRLGKRHCSFNYNWSTVSVKLQRPAVKALLDTTERDEGGGRDQVEQMKSFDFSVNWSNDLKVSANERKHSELWGFICLREKSGIWT